MAGMAEERVPYGWWLLTGLGAMAPVFVIGAAIASQEAVNRLEFERKEALERLPAWFPAWLAEESTPAELKEYFHMIYWGGMAQDDMEKIPSQVYHVTPNPEEIMQVGFRTAAELGVAGFGGTGDYISVTTLENAETYQENMRAACRVLNGMMSLREVKEWMVRQAGGREEPFNKAFATAKGYHPSLPEEGGLDDPAFNTPEFLWEVFSHGFIMDGPGFVLFMGRPTLVHKRCENIKIIEAQPSPRLRFRHLYNIFEKTVMRGRYTYNKLEKEWRVYDSSDLKPLRILVE